MFNVLHKLKAAVDADILTPDEAETMVKAPLFGHDAGSTPDQMRFCMFKWPDPHVEERLKNTELEPAAPKKAPALGGIGLRRNNELENA